LSSARLIAIDDAADVALLRLVDGKALDETCKLHVTKAWPRPGDVVHYTGYPLLSDVPMSLWAHVASEPTTIPEHVIAQLLGERAVPPIIYLGSRIMLDEPIQGGASGSPVRLATDGSIFGIASGTFNAPVIGGNGQTRAFGYVIPLDRLIQMLDEYKVPYTAVKGRQ